MGKVQVLNKTYELMSSFEVPRDLSVVLTDFLTLKIEGTKLVCVSQFKGQILNQNHELIALLKFEDVQDLAVINNNLLQFSYQDVISDLFIDETDPEFESLKHGELSYLIREL